MSQKPNAAQIGAFLVGAAVLAVVALLTFGSGTLFRETLPCVTFFEEDINGLSNGAPVKFKGVEIGSVKEIRLPIDDSTADPLIQVRYELNAQRIAMHGEATGERLEAAVRDGLRARLATESWVTGVLYVTLEIDPAIPGTLHGAPSDFTEIPALPSRTRQIQNFFEKAAISLTDVPIKETVEAARDALRALDERLRSPELERSIAAAEKTFVSADRTFASLTELADSLRADSRRVAEELDATLAAARGAFARMDRALESGEKTFDDVARDLKADVQALTGTMRDAAARLQGTLTAAEAILDPRAPLVESLQTSLVELGRAARALGQFADALQRDPTLLLRGREAPEDSK